MTMPAPSGKRADSVASHRSSYLGQHVVGSETGRHTYIEFEKDGEFWRYVGIAEEPDESAPEWNGEVSGDTLPPLPLEGADEALRLLAPPARGMSPSGSPIDIGGPTGGSSVVVFIAGWDPHSPQILQGAQMLADGMDNAEVTVVASMTGPFGVEYPEPFLRDNGWRGPTLVDDVDAVTGAYGISAFPTTAVIDEEGNIASRIAGVFDIGALEVN